MGQKSKCFSKFGKHTKRKAFKLYEQSVAIRAQNINPSILTWARETAGLSIDEAADRLGLSSSEKATGAEKLEAFEAGDTKPTRNQLLKLASVYRRPLTTFYRNTPPRKADRGEDFRTLAGTVPPQDNALLDALVRDVRVRQDLVRAIIEDDEDAEPLRFVGSLGIEMPANTAALQIKESLGLVQENWTREFNSPDALFADLRNRIEALGVFVLLIGNLGSHHTSISTSVFRGFAIADDLAPFIVINDQDARAARAFTLAHELVHLFVGATGVSANPSIQTPRTRNARVERFCNDVAGELLLPTASLTNIARMTNTDQASGVISEIADTRNLSKPMVAYRLQRIGRLDNDTYSQLHAEYAAGWQNLRQREREKVRDSDSGPSYYTVRKHRLGNALLSLVGRTLRENQLTHTTAARMLGVKPSSVDPLLKNVKGINGSLLPKAGG
ncbi:MAG: XRE family transcriptional regulator [Roseovarius sp.]|nr:XRE family transcriptional regulator [Roseovarius sp.]